MKALGIISFVVALLLSVMIHEGGHFLTARRFGMKATEFFVGFGPTLWSRRRGETEYGIKAIPAGGYVKIIGMTALEEVDSADAPRAFFSKPAWQRAVVLAAGSFMHFVLAVVLVFASLWIGGKTDNEQPVLTLSPCLTQPCSAGQDATPARAAGLQTNDRVVAVNGTPVSTFTQLSAAIKKASGPVTLEVRRGQSIVVRTVTPASVTVPDPADPARTTTVKRIGITNTVVVNHLGPLSAASQTPGVIGQFVTGTASALAHFPSRLSTIFSPNRDPAGAAGVVGISRVSGDVLAAPAEPLSVRIAGLVLIVASVNLFVGVFNLLPLLPLDGGHVAILAFEQGRDRVRRRRGYRGQLQRVDLNKLLPATYAVMAVFVVLTLVLASADIVNPIRLR